MGNAIGRPHRGGCELFTGGQSEYDGGEGFEDIDRDIDNVSQMCMHDCHLKTDTMKLCIFVLVQILLK